MNALSSLLSLLLCCPLPQEAPPPARKDAPPPASRPAEQPAAPPAPDLATPERAALSCIRAGAMGSMLGADLFIPDERAMERLLAIATPRNAAQGRARMAQMRKMFAAKPGNKGAKGEAERYTVKSVTPSEGATVVLIEELSSSPLLAAGHRASTHRIEVVRVGEAWRVRAHRVSCTFCKGTGRCSRCAGKKDEDEEAPACKRCEGSGECWFAHCKGGSIDKLSLEDDDDAAGGPGMLDSSILGAARAPDLSAPLLAGRALVDAHARLMVKVADRFVQGMLHLGAHLVPELEARIKAKVDAQRRGGKAEYARQLASLKLVSEEGARAVVELEEKPGARVRYLLERIGAEWRLDAQAKPCGRCKGAAHCPNEACRENPAMGSTCPGCKGAKRCAACKGSGWSVPR